MRGYKSTYSLRCTQARKATHGLDGQHQDVDRTPRGRVSQTDRGQGYMEKVRPWCVQPSDRGRLKNRTHSVTHSLFACDLCSFLELEWSPSCRGFQLTYARHWLYSTTTVCLSFRFLSLLTKPCSLTIRYDTRCYLFESLHLGCCYFRLQPKIHCNSLRLKTHTHTHTADWAQLHAESLILASRPS